MWDETKRKAFAAMYRANGQDVPRHLLPDLDTNLWRRYELEKEIGNPAFVVEAAKIWNE